MSLERHASTARALARQGYVDETLDALVALVRAAGMHELQLNLDDQERIVVDCPFDARFVASLRAIPGTYRDKQQSVWRVPKRGFLRLTELLERRAGPPCSPAGCTRDDDPPPTDAHHEAHAQWCGG